MKLTAIVACGSEGEIGLNGHLPWSPISGDMARFRALTMGKPVIMGRKTWESLPEKYRPLPGRHNIVLSRTMAPTGDCEVVTSKEDALLEAQATVDDTDEAFVIGGAEIYDLFWDEITTVALTLVQGSFAYDVRFPLERLCALCDGVSWTWTGGLSVGDDANPVAIFHTVFRDPVPNLPGVSETQQSVGEWANTTFGVGDPTDPRQASRLLEETFEFARAWGLTQAQCIAASEKAYAGMGLHESRPESAEKVEREGNDMDIVLDVIFHRRGWSRQAGKDAKMQINRERQWHCNGDGTGYHIKAK